MGSGWKVIGSGPMADAVRAELARDPDRYRPETWSINPFAHCPCCDEDIFRCTTRHTGWVEGFATHSHKVHPRVDPKTGLRDPNGTVAACCCVAPNFGPAHVETPKPKPGFTFTDVPCPTCGAKPGDRCIRLRGYAVLKHQHDARIQASIDAAREGAR